MKPRHVSIGELTDFCRGGDINFRFSARSSALEGLRGHQRVQGLRGKEYLAEYPVEGEFYSGSIKLSVGGRIDGVGYDPVRALFYLDEIKTLRVSLSDIPQSVLDSYWHQALLYASLLMSVQPINTLVVRLCFYHLDEDAEEIVERVVGRQEVTQLLIDSLGRYLARLEQREDWRLTRDTSLKDLAFPYGEFRAGQRDFSVAVYRAISRGEHLAVEAPTGTGKTMATLYPAMTSLREGASERVFYLSARTATQVLASNAIKDIGRIGGKLRAVVLTAKDKICFSPGEPCHPDHCTFAQSYYDKLPEAIDKIIASDRLLDRTAIEQAAKEDHLCPFELGLDIASECDVIISDYNYVFDPTVYLRRFFDSGRQDSVALVDEAHNLLDRGREMYSASVSRQDFLTVTKYSSIPSLQRTAKAVNRAILTLRRAHTEQLDAQGYMAIHEIPASLSAALRRFIEAAEISLRDLPQAALLKDPAREQLLDTYFDAIRFSRTAERFDKDYVLLLQSRTQARGRSRDSLKLYCVDPSAGLSETFARLQASVVFSATLTPAGYFRQTLGLPDDAHWYRLPSPFPANNKLVTLADYIDTSFKGRGQSTDDLVRLIQQIRLARSGNYLVFFPSYAYLEDVASVYEAMFPGEPVLSQARDMTDAARADFLNAFSRDTDVCGFAVMGGAFAEGIDLKGDVLIGVIVVGPGLPQIGAEREVIRARYGAEGFAIAYRYPGLIKVLQTAGRLIRSASDQGVLCLVDARYREPEYLGQLPGDWQPKSCHNLAQVGSNIAAFWEARK